MLPEERRVLRDCGEAEAGKGWASSHPLPPLPGSMRGVRIIYLELSETLAISVLTASLPSRGDRVVVVRLG